MVGWGHFVLGEKVKRAGHYALKAHIVPKCAASSIAYSPRQAQGSGSCFLFPRPPHVGLTSKVLAPMSICPHCVVAGVSLVSLSGLSFFILDYLEAGWSAFRSIAAELLSLSASERI